MKYFRIKNWEKYQHRDALRGHGPMVFIRMQTDIFDDVKFWRMSWTEKAVFLQLLLIAGKFRNRVPDDLRFLADIMHTVRLPNIQFMWDMGLIEACDASNLPATCQQLASLEKRREEKSIYSEDNAAALPQRERELGINSYQEAAETVLNHLNSVASKKFTPKAQIPIISRALKWGFSVDQLKDVINIKFKDPYFKENPKYMRPITLFQSAEKIDGYLNEKKGSGTKPLSESMVVYK